MLVKVHHITVLLLEINKTLKGTTGVGGRCTGTNPLLLQAV